MKKYLFLFALFLALPLTAAAREYNPNFFTILPSFDDRAYAWNAFRSGGGPDWNWQLTIPEGKQLKRISIENGCCEGWSTGSADVVGKKPYPIVVAQNGKQINLEYNHDLSKLKGTIRLYTQMGSSALNDPKVTIMYLDGTETVFYALGYAYYGENSNTPSAPWVAIDSPNGFESFDPGQKTQINFRKNTEHPIDIELWETDKVPNQGLVLFKKVSDIVLNYTGTSSYQWTVPKIKEGNAYRIYVKYHAMPEVVGDITDNSFAIILTDLVSEVKKTTTQILRN